MDSTFETHQSVDYGRNFELEDLAFCFRQKAETDATYRVYNDREIEQIGMCMLNRGMGRFFNTIIAEEGKGAYTPWW